MSADLLAEFDSFYQAPAPATKQIFENKRESRHKPLETSNNSSNTKRDNADVFGTYGSWNVSSGPTSSQPSITLSPRQWAPVKQDQQPEERETDDDWGDFETGQASSPQMKQAQVPYGNNVMKDIYVERANSGYASESAQKTSPDTSNFSLYPLATADKEQVNWESSQAQRPKSHRKPSRGPRDANVLFDAEEDQDDDFGGFHSSDGRSNTAPKPITKPPTTLLDFDSMMSESYSQPPVSNIMRPALAPTPSSFESWTQNTGLPEVIQPISADQQAWDTPDAVLSRPDIVDKFHNPAKGTAFARTEQQSKESTHGIMQSMDQSEINSIDDNAWDDFDTNISTKTNGYTRDMQIDQRAHHSASLGSASNGQIVASGSPDQSFLNTGPLPRHIITTVSSNPVSTSAPPANIPPPSVLLPLFVPMFNQAQNQLFGPLASRSTTSATRDAVLSHPETQTFLASYLAIVAVMARLIAGRKLRWKRDTLLAQSMRIGPASSSGKSGGMKLAGIDKTEHSREESEVADILRLWRGQIGRLRSAVLDAASGTLPELAENMIVRTAKETEGALTAPRACALCGLKRNERVVKIDFEVQDSFGEWWIDHWGHRACKSFWDVQKGNLSTR